MGERYFVVFFCTNDWFTLLGGPHKTNHWVSFFLWQVMCVVSIMPGERRHRLVGLRSLVEIWFAEKNQCQNLWKT